MTPNINFRRVRNIKIFFDFYAQSLPICTTEECFSQGLWQPGDIVPFDKLPGGLWHIAIISNRYKIISSKEKIGVPLLIHNGDREVKESNRLLGWAAPITGHYRIPLNQLSHENLSNFLLSMHIGT